MRTLRYHRVDVFSEEPFGGNPLAVFPAADDLAPGLMQKIAREMNLSETVFVSKPTESADVRLRIFTVDRELPMAGHPVIGTHFVLAATGRYQLRSNGATAVTAQLGAGVLPAEIFVEDGVVKSVLMTQRTPAFAPALVDRVLVARALGLKPEQIGPGDLPVRVVDTGVPWLIVPLVNRRAIEGLAPMPSLCQQVAEIAGTDMIYAFTGETRDETCAVHARHVWFGTVTPGEDPVTGSAAGCLASYLVFERVLLAAPHAELWIEQGVEIGRPGRVRARIEAEETLVQRVQIGGSAVHIGDGELRIP